MRFDGNLKTWNDDGGFGFIATAQGGDDIFVHISAFPHGRRPTIGECGEPLSFEIDHNKDGKKRAVDVRRPLPAGFATPSKLARQVDRPPRRSYLSVVIVLALVAGIGGYGYSVYSKRVRAISEGIVGSTPAQPEAPLNARCDGRVHCSLMTSCAEATFFLRHKDQSPMHCRRAELVAFLACNASIGCPLAGNIPFFSAFRETSTQDARALSYTRSFTPSPC
jgi:cold shock CspA family protein